MAEHHQVSGGVKKALTIGVVDAVIEPPDTRRWLAKALAAAPDRRGAHGNIPL
jgi:acetyl-CoA/propionyl-CoA carboxylase carboxyl transferase subunit